MTVLTAVDIQTGLGSAVVTPSKGRDQYCIAELKRFVFEIGRTYGIIQYDPEPSLRALVSETLTELGGMSMRATPRDWKQAHGFVGKSQQTFTVKQEQSDCNYRSDTKCKFPCNMPFIHGS